MNYVRTIAWLLLLTGLVAFSVANWDPVTVRIWENLVVETKLPAIVVLSFLLGFVPMWLIHRASKWRTARRIASLEASARVSAMPPPVETTPTEPEPVPPVP